MSWLSILTMTCDEATHLASCSMDSELTRRQRWGLQAHVAICKGCRRFQAQLRMLRQSLRRQVNAAGVDSLMPSDRLSTEGRERLKRALSTSD